MFHDIRAQCLKISKILWETVYSFESLIGKYPAQGEGWECRPRFHKPTVRVPTQLADYSLMSRVNLSAHIENQGIPMF